MFARFDENPAMTLRVIKETKRYGRTDGRTDRRTDGRTDGRTDNVKTVYPLQTKFAGGITSAIMYRQLCTGVIFCTFYVIGVSNYSNQSILKKGCHSCKYCKFRKVC